MRILILTLWILIFSLPVAAQEPSKAFRTTDLPLPRFVSLHSGEVYVRSGPGQKYPVQWILKKKGLPLEIILEYDIWRKVKDYDGHEGWVHKSLLSGRRTGFIHNDKTVSIHRKPNDKSKIHAYLEPEVLVEIEQCVEGWCHVNASGYKGWLPQKFIWGVYEDEEFD
ncbi:MAG: SH3 domain-containing protein [Rhodospirillales bacterium]|nr:SH3 domain-containing protein [Alphaproteobacteria bacterium]MCB9981626.1 SH3 domain-containing protein [Rhodospirillales bacterium]